MRHQQHRHKLGVKTAHRAALLSNLAAALIRHKRIRTTQAKAKALRPFVERVITLARKGYEAETPEARLHFRRLALSRVRDPEAVRMLFQERVEEFLNRDGGYTRIYKLVARRGDAAEMALIELIDADDEGYSKPKKKSRKRSRKGSGAAPAETGATAETSEPAAAEVTAEEAVAGEESGTGEEAGEEATTVAPEPEATAGETAEEAGPATTGEGEPAPEDEERS